MLQIIVFVAGASGRLVMLGERGNVTEQGR
jgi:hypothetical protein